jgi:hypothetical protein
MGKCIFPEPIHRYSIPAQQVGEFSNIRRNPAPLILRQQLGR